MEQSKAQKKVFSTPEVVERLISFLDSKTTLCLAESHMVGKETLRQSLGSEVWNQLIRRGSENGHLLQEEHVKHFVKILKLIEVEEPSKFILPLLDHICNSRPVWPDMWEWGWESVKMICPCSTEPHIILPGAFPLLELVEGAFGTKLQSIKSVRVEILREPLLLAICSRMSRMPVQVPDHIEIEFDHRIEIESKNSVQAFVTLLQAQLFSLRIDLWVSGAIEEEGWQMLARALRDKPESVKLGWVRSSRQGWAEARMEDVKDIWDAIDVSYTLSNAYRGFRIKHSDRIWQMGIECGKNDWESACIRLNQILAMTEDEFNAKIDRRSRGFDSEDSFDDRDSEGGESGEEVGEEEEHDDGKDGGEEEEVIESEKEGEKLGGEGGGE